MPLLDCLVIAALEEEAAVTRSILQAAALRTGKATRGRFTIDLYRLARPGGDSLVVGFATPYGMTGLKMGPFAAAVLEQFTPAATMLTGIAATAEGGKTNLGDVMIADQAISTGNLAITDHDFHVRRVGYQVDSQLKTAAQDISGHLDEFERWQDACIETIIAVVPRLNRARPIADLAIPEGLPRPQLKTGTVASGPFMVKSEDFIRKLIGKSIDENGNVVDVEPKVDSKVTWIEMESDAFLQAASDKRVPALAIKGISDKGDADKTQLERTSRGFFRVYAGSNATVAVLAALQHPNLVPCSVNEVGWRKETDLKYFSHLMGPLPEEGAQAPAFQTLLSSSGPLLDAKLSVSAERDGHPVVPRAWRAEIRQGGMATPLHAKVQGQGLAIPLGYLEEKVELGLALVLSPPASSVRFALLTPPDPENVTVWRPRQ